MPMIINAKSRARRKAGSYLEQSRMTTADLEKMSFKQ
jgi:hypothetical protein